MEFDHPLSGKLHIASPWLGPEKRVEDGYSFFRYSHSPFARLDQSNEYMQWLLDQGIDPASVFHRKPPGLDTEFGAYLPSIKPEIHQTTWGRDELGDTEDRNPNAEFRSRAKREGLPTRNKFE